MPNRLSNETSPYLRQHADNPVDWFPWGQEAFDLARQKDRPILLSIGYSACHWCHVMAHESFEDEDTAALMNRAYVNIKVDREEHPDVDQIYQHALQIFGEHGGWPLTVFLTPAGEPFFGGTYFPPRDNFGRPSFRRVLEALSEAYKSRRDEVVEQGRKVIENLGKLESSGQGQEIEEQLPDDFAERAAGKLAVRMDPHEGGFAGSPKFPNPSSLELQLRAFARSREAGAAAPVLLTLSRMAAGGIYDQLGGGFARYSTDDHWLVPHFEKMLYDNGQLLRLYAEGHQIATAAGRPEEARRHAQVIRETHGWIEREMRDPSGGLYTAQDADSEGVEGKYFVFTPAQVKSLCTPEEAAVLMRCYDVRVGGNWHDPHGHGPKGASILHVIDTPRDPAEEQLLCLARGKLFAERRRRVPPATDDKVLTGWNGLAITGLSEAGRVLGEPAILASARRTADFLLARLRDPKGRLLRVFTEGPGPGQGEGKKNGARLPATLDDHAFLAEGLIHLAGATGELHYLEEAKRLMDAVLADFYDQATHAFYLTPGVPGAARPGGPGDGAAAPISPASNDGADVRTFGDETLPILPVRPTSLRDSAIPSGMSVACLNLLRLSELFGTARCGHYRQVAEQALLRHGDQALRNPFGLSSLCAAIDLYQHGLTLVVIVAPHDAAAAALRRAADAVYLPDGFILSVSPAQAMPAGLSERVAGKGLVNGQAAAYVCRGQTCSAPVTDPAALTQFLFGTGGGG